MRNKEEVTKSIDSQGKLTDELVEKIQKAEQIKHTYSLYIF